MTSRLSPAVILLALAAACNDRIPTYPLGPAQRMLSADKKVDAAPITLRWHQVARDRVSTTTPFFIAPAATRMYAVLSIAQYAAAASAEPEDVQDGAIAGASAVVLTYFFPAGATAFEALVREQSPTWPPGHVRQYERGEERGRAIGAAFVDRARNDHFDDVWTGTVPVCPGCWINNGPPVKPLLGKMTPFVLQSGDQFRPLPPPAFGSADFLRDLAEVRHISDTRTPEQLRIALSWAFVGGSPSTQGFWDNQAVQLIAREGLRERDATHVFALMHATAGDASIACWDAKYTYWLLRPSQADPGITMPIALPNHPSYTSGHSCLSSASVAVLDYFFPGEAPRLDAMVTEAGLARIYAGIHYRFDVETGRELGNNVAAYTIGVDNTRGILSNLP